MKNIVFYSLVRGVGSSTIAYQLARLLRFEFIQENKNDLVAYLKSVHDTDRYVLKYLSEIDRDYLDDEYSACIVDVEKPHAWVMNRATDIVILTNNSHLDLLKTIRTIQEVEKYNNAKIHVVFNRLQNGTVEREKKYTLVSESVLKENTKRELFFSYIRNNLIYYRDIKNGNFFMNSFFKPKNELVRSFPELFDTDPMFHLKNFYNKLYNKQKYKFKNADTPFVLLEESDEQIAKLIYSGDYINAGKVVIKDMYLLIKNLEIENAK